MKLPRPPLLLVTDRKQARTKLADVVGAALAAGCRWVSVREKDLPPEAQVALARALLPAVRRHSAVFTLHGDPALARAAGLDGVHLPAGSDVAAARATLGPACLVGVSVHTEDEAAALDPALVDYAIAGPAFPTLSKPGYGPFLGADGICRVASLTCIPVIAIGGVEPENAGALLSAGAAGVAVMGGIMRAADPAAETARLLAAVRAGPTSSKLAQLSPCPRESGDPAP